MNHAWPHPYLSVGGLSEGIKVIAAKASPEREEDSLAV